MNILENASKLYVNNGTFDIKNPNRNLQTHFRPVCATPRPATWTYANETPWSFYRCHKPFATILLTMKLSF